LNFEGTSYCCVIAAVDIGTHQLPNSHQNHDAEANNHDR
jgi:hypothetical protein